MHMLHQGSCIRQHISTSTSLLQQSHQPTTRLLCFIMAPNTLLRLIKIVDNVPLNFVQNHSPYIPLLLTPTSRRAHGYIHPNTLHNLPWPESFSVSDHAVVIKDASTGVNQIEHVNKALQDAVDAAIDSGKFPTLNGLHSEPFRILGFGPRESIIQLERFAAPLFGIATRGAHLTAYVRGPDNQPKIWVARRSAHLHTYPSKLDSTIAGGVKASDTPTGCILAEAHEEASLSSALVQRLAKPVGVLTLANKNPRTELFHSEILYVYDMELPADVTPKPGDDEVEEFVLMDVDEVRRRMEDGEFKPNVCAVMVDFFIRHGVVSPESEGEGAYVGICGRLRRELPVPLGVEGEE